MQLTGRNLHIVYNYYSHDTDANDYVERDHDALVVQACLSIKDGVFSSLTYLQ